MDDFYAARDSTMQPLPWPSIAPPFTRLGCKSKFSEVDYLLHVLSHEWPRGHWTCSCGSGKRIRECCKDNLHALSLDVGSEEARAMRKRLHELSE